MQKILCLIAEEDWDFEWELIDRESVNAWIEGIDEQRGKHLVWELCDMIGVDLLKFVLGERISDKDARKMVKSYYDSNMLADALLE